MASARDCIPLGSLDAQLPELRGCVASVDKKSGVGIIECHVGSGGDWSGLLQYAFPVRSEGKWSQAQASWRARPD